MYIRYGVFTFDLIIIHQNSKTMTPLFETLQFETEVGTLRIDKIQDGWVYEFVSGYNNGLHLPVPVKSFDLAYRLAKKAASESAKEMKEEIQ